VCRIGYILQKIQTSLFHSIIIKGSSLTVSFLVQYPHTGQYWNSSKSLFSSLEWHSGQYFKKGILISPTKLLIEIPFNLVLSQLKRSSFTFPASFLTSPVPFPNPSSDFLIASPVFFPNPSSAFLIASQIASPISLRFFTVFPVFHSFCYFPCLSSFFPTFPTPFQLFLTFPVLFRFPEL
jgi:hypothetical protein